MKHFTSDFIKECRARLIEAKSDLMNSLRTRQSEFEDRERGGDEADQSVSVLAEHQFLVNQNRLRQQLLEIESALSRIEKGGYGVCEETEEPIEAERLRAIPWTRLSVEGAEIREAIDMRFARRG